MCCLVFIVSACDSSTSPVGPDPEPVTLTYDFDDGQQGWTGFFTNYTVDESEGMDLVAEYQRAPQLPAIDQAAYVLGATNTSDDVKMLLKERVEGLEPNTTYAIAYEVTFGTNAASGCVGIGGAPGEAVTVLALASTDEPGAVVRETGGRDYYRLNAELKQIEDDFGGDDAAWLEAVIIGHIANSSDDCGSAEYELKTVASEDNQWRVTTDADGAAWLIVGTRSGFEGRTVLYYTQINATMEPVS